MKLENRNVVGKPVDEILDHVFECHDEIKRLRKALDRANRECEHMHHDRHEYHEHGDCPVEKWVNDALDSRKEEEA